MSSSRRPVRRALGLALALLAPVAALGAADQAQAAAPAPLDFSACPAFADLPQGADPAVWRCEVMSVTGSITIGRISEPITTPLVITHAEGRVGERHVAVFGGMSADPIPVKGTPLTVTPRYAGYFNPFTNSERVGELDLAFELSGPGLPRACSIGSDDSPVHLVLKAAPAPDTSIQDTDFTAPRTSGCGLLGPVLDRALGLPSAAGSNSIHLGGERGMRYYNEPQAR